MAVTLLLTPGAAMSQQTQTPDASASAEQRTRVPSDVRGVWVWSADWINTDEAQDELLGFCQKFGINRILIQIHDLKTGDGVYRIKYPKELTRLIAEARARGIAVEALDGANNMAFAENHERTLEALDALIELNQSMPKGQRFEAIHYDIEPYTSELWRSGQAGRDKAMLDLLVYYTKARQRLNERGSSMMLAADIPMWYDAKTADDDHCVVTFNGETKNLHKHIQDICDYVGIMSYRKHVLGPNSVTDHIENELAYAESIGKKVCAALETIRLDDTPQITFYGEPSGVFLEAVDTLTGHHEGRPGYAGVLLHSYRGLRDLLLEEASR